MLARKHFPKLQIHSLSTLYSDNIWYKGKSIGIAPLLMRSQTWHEKISHLMFLGLTWLILLSPVSQNSLQDKELHFFFFFFLAKLSFGSREINSRKHKEKDSK